MIVSWMLYSLLVGLLLGLAAVPLERVLRLAGRPGRWVWIGAMAGALLVPVVSFVLAGRATEPTGAGLGPVVPVAAPVSTTLGAVTHDLESAAAPVLRGVEAPVLRLWALATLLLVTLLGASLLRLARFRRRCPERFLDGRLVLLSRNVGPAVVGFVRPRIVVPRWLLERGTEARAMILDHEREHCRARDPLVVLLAAVPALLFPWNVPLWWCLARLRLAVELDCDQRVMRAATPGTRRRYGQLLVQVGSRPAGPLTVLAAFSERRSSLERRVRALTERMPRNRIRRTAGLTGVGLAAALAACVVPSPDAPETSLEPEMAEAESEAVGGEPHFTPHTVPPVLRNLAEVQAAFRDAYPPMLRDAGVEGVVDLWVHLDETGAVRQTRLNRSSGYESLDRVALRGGRVMRFSPALNRDEAVPVWISLPVRFDVDRVVLPGGEPPAAPRAGELEPGTELPPEIEIPNFPILERPGRVEAAPRPAGEAARLSERPVFTPHTEPPTLRNRDEVLRLLRERYPPLLRDAGIGGTVDVWTFIDATGRVLNTQVNRSSGHEALDEAALRVAEDMEFTPALNGDGPVPVWVSVPVQFDSR